MKTIDKDRNTLKRLVESYGKEDVVKFVKHIDEVAADPRVAFLDRVISRAEHRKWCGIKYNALRELGMNDIYGCIDYGVNEIKNLAPDIDDEEVARILFRIYYAAQGNVDKGNMNDFARW